jgi:hypothetical protein
MWHARQCLFKCLSVDLSRKMNRAFSIDRVPAGWIGAAKKLHFQSDTDGRLCCGQADNAFDCLPGRATWGASFDGDIVYLSVSYLNFEFRSTEAFSIVTQTTLPGKTASRGG